MARLGPRLSGLAFLPPFFLPSSPGEDPAIQIPAEIGTSKLDHRVSTLRVGPAMTEKNQNLVRDEI
jgi:hypothetical protein